MPDAKRIITRIIAAQQAFKGHAAALHAPQFNAVWDENFSSLEGLKS
jgi:hypothetical protein